MKNIDGRFRSSPGITGKEAGEDNSIASQVRGYTTWIVHYEMIMGRRLPDNFLKNGMNILREINGFIDRYISQSNDRESSFFIHDKFGIDTSIVVIQ